jgi:hypothetical protein
MLYRLFNRPAVLNASVMTELRSKCGRLESDWTFGGSTSPSSGSDDVSRDRTDVSSTGALGGLGDDSGAGRLAVRPKNLAIWYEEEIPTSRRNGPGAPH